MKYLPTSRVVSFWGFSCSSSPFCEIAIYCGWMTSCLLPPLPILGIHMCAFKRVCSWPAAPWILFKHIPQSNLLLLKWITLTKLGYQKMAVTPAWVTLLIYFILWSPLLVRHALSSYSAPQSLRDSPLCDDPAAIAGGPSGCVSMLFVTSYCYLFSFAKAAPSYLH